MSFSSGIEIVASSTNAEFLFGAPTPENNGAGGRGLLGLPPYLDDGVPGRELPLRSAGSKLATGGGTLAYSALVLDGLHDLVGLILPLGLYEV